jgi:hypothetical protein
MATLNQYNVNNTNGLLYFSLIENPVVEPLDGPLFVEHLMARFPEETYTKSRDSHLYRFLTAIVGDSGSGLLKKQSLFARLQFESAALGFKGLDKLYSPLINFGRISGEKYSIDPKTSALTSEEWDAIKSADNAYRSRAFSYLQAARQGGTPSGLAAAASAAIGRPTQIVENYKHLFDSLSDNPIGYDKIGLTNSTSEFVIRPTVNKSQAATDIYATFYFAPDVDGIFRFKYNGEYSSFISTKNISAAIILHTLVGFSFLENGDVSVSQRASTAFEIRFVPVDVRKLSIESDNLTVGTDIILYRSSDNELFYSSSFGDPSQDYFNSFVSGTSSTQRISGATTTVASTTVSSVYVPGGLGSAYKGWGISGNGIPSGTTILNVVDPTTVRISASATVTQDGTATLYLSPPQRQGATEYLSPDIQKNLDNLVSRIKPTTSLFSISPSEDKYTVVGINGVHATSSRLSVNRFVSANSSVNYPGVDFLQGKFLEVGSENEERNYAFTSTDLPVVFITIDSVIAYTNNALTDPAYSTSDFYAGNAKYKKYESIHVGSYQRDESLIFPSISAPIDTPLYASNILPAAVTNAIARGAITT